MPEETPELPTNPPEPQIEAPSLMDKLKIHKWKVLVGVISLLALAGAAFGAYLLIQDRAQPVTTPPPAQTPTPSPAPKPEPEATTGCESDNDCVLAIRLDRCCSCPEAVSREALQKDENLIEYILGKNYLERLKIDCSTVDCHPCPLLKNITCEFGTCKTVQKSELTEVIIGGTRGDEVDPGPIEDECQRRTEDYVRGVQGNDFRERGFLACSLITSKVGNLEECEKYGFRSSTQGCAICTLECR